MVGQRPTVVQGVQQLAAELVEFIQRQVVQRGDVALPGLRVEALGRVFEQVVEALQGRVGGFCLRSGLRFLRGIRLAGQAQGLFVGFAQGLEAFRVSLG